MIHILTIHWKSDRWIDIQLAYIKKYIKEPYKIYTFLNDIPIQHNSKFFYVSTENIQSHPIKLNLLADMAILNSNNPHDWLIFLDGDAFPIKEIVPFAKEKLRTFPLIAIQRNENIGDKQPHPSFCLTTIQFWKKIKGDWKSGYSWKSSNNKFYSDVGGNILQKLTEENIEWYPLIRSNKVNLHPLWFGIYEDLIYHHGAGFRKPFSRVDMQKSFFLVRLYFNILFKLPNLLQKKLDITHVIFKKNVKLSKRVFKMIQSDSLFYKNFI